MNIAKTFESEKNRKALIYTAVICGTLLLLFILISWKIVPPVEPVAQDLIEVNLGNESEGFGDVQPLIKGDKGLKNQDESDNNKQTAPPQQEDEKVTPDDNAENDAAPVTKTETKKVIKPSPIVTPTKPVVAPTPKPAKAKYEMAGGTKTSNGNNPTEDNGYKYQGNNPNGTGDAGSPNGNKDSYGNSPGGKTGGKVAPPRITRYYSFNGDLPKATIFALVNVSGGRGTLIKLVKPSTSFDNRYAEAVRSYLRNMEFDKSQEGTTTVPFNFNVK